MRAPVHRGVWLLLLPLLAVTVFLAGCGGTGLDLSPAATSTPTPPLIPLTPAPTQVLGLAFVAGSGGDRVYLRTLPSNAPEVRGDAWDEGTQLEVVGEELQAAGRSWMRVKDPKGGVGYMPAEFLITATPTSTPRVTATHTPAPSPTAPPTAVATETPRPTAEPTLAPPPPSTDTPAATATGTPTASPVPTQVTPPTAEPSPTLLETPVPAASQTPPPTETPAAPTATPQQGSAKLALLSTVESKSVAFATVEGFVRNISGEVLENVKVVVQYVAADGRTVARGSAGIANTFLGPTQSSAFKVLVPVEPGMANFVVSFVGASGQPIASVDQR